MSDIKAKMHQIQFRLGLRPRPHWGSLQRSPRPPSWWAGGSLPPPQEPHPCSRPFGPRCSALRASMFGPAGLSTRPFGPRCPSPPSYNSLKKALPLKAIQRHRNRHGWWIDPLPTTY